MFANDNVPKLFLMWDILHRIIFLFCCRVFYIRQCSYFVVGCLTLVNVTIFECITVKYASLDFPIFRPIPLPFIIHVAPNLSWPTSVVVGLLNALLPLSALGLCSVGMEHLTPTSTLVLYVSSAVSSVPVVLTTVYISVPHCPFYNCINFCLPSDRHVHISHCYHPFDIRLDTTNCCYCSDRFDHSICCSSASNCVLNSTPPYGKTWYKCPFHTFLRVGGGCTNTPSGKFIQTPTSSWFGGTFTCLTLSPSSELDFNRLRIPIFASHIYLLLASWPRWGQRWYTHLVPLSAEVNQNPSMLMSTCCPTTWCYMSALIHAPDFGSNIWCLPQIIYLSQTHCCDSTRSS